MNIVRIFLLSIFCQSLSFASHLEHIHIVSYDENLLPGEEKPYKYSLIQDHFNVSFHFDLYEYVRNFQSDFPALKKIVFLDYCGSEKTKQLPCDKLICFKWEAVRVKPKFYDFYHRVYTFDDDLVDNVKFFKFYYPVWQPMIPTCPTFEEKNLCVMIVSNWIPERIKMLTFFHKMPHDSLHVYGRNLPPRHHRSKMNKGEIGGFYSGNKKLEILKNYKFCLCFENTHTVPGYITEKIFDVFAAGCIPIYWGPENVEKYIPKDCFIDYRDFKDNEALYDFMTSITKSDYERYIHNIKLFLQSKEAHLFSQENFEQILYKAVVD